MDSLRGAGCAAYQKIWREKCEAEQCCREFECFEYTRKLGEKEEVMHKKMSVPKPDIPKRNNALLNVVTPLG